MTERSSVLPPKIRVRGLTRSFGSHRVLDGMDLDVASGESIVLIGPSGTGKSVFLKHVIGLLTPDAGTIEVDGTAVERLRGRELTQFRRKFGMAFQEGALFDSMTVRQNIAFPLRRLARMSSREIGERVEACLELVQLEGAGDQMPSELSGGMRRRVGFARAVAHQPEILLFDEPTTGLDPVTKAQIEEVIVDLNDRLRTTTITITHDLKGAFHIGDRIAMLHRGKIIAQGPPDAFRQLADERVQQFIHGSAHGPLTAHAPRNAGRPPR